MVLWLRFDTSVKSMIKCFHLTILSSPRTLPQKKKDIYFEKDIFLRIVY